MTHVPVRTGQNFRNGTGQFPELTPPALRVETLRVGKQVPEAMKGLDDGFARASR